MARLAEDATVGGVTAPGDAAARARADALHEALRPMELEPVRRDRASSAIRRGETFAHAAHERLGLAAAVEQHRGLGYAYGDQAVLCRKNKQVHEIAAVLTGQGVPVSQLGDFFDRPEVKDALMLVMLAAGPDARGLLRAALLLVGLGYPLPAASELAAAAHKLTSQRQLLPGALRHSSSLLDVAALSETTRAALTRLGEVTTQLRNGHAVGAGLADFLLRPGGYAWRLVRIADGLDAPQLGELPAEGRAELVPWEGSPVRAQQALAALGELVRLARRFDARWAREPDFRARLSRAVTHRRVPQPAEPDALERVPGADVTFNFSQTLAIGAASSTLDAVVSPTASVVRCFLHYLGALRTAGAAVPVPAGEEDAVHVLTLHQSKGLEFPVVYLPGLAQGQFPAGMSVRDEVCPPGFRESDAPGEDEAEERCLFYVGVTRARDIVAFTRAANYSHTARTAAPSSLLTLVDGLLGGTEAGSLLPDADLELLEATAVFETAGGNEQDDEEPEEVILEAQSLDYGNSATDKPLFQLHELEQYLACPLQYKYARSYGLLDPAENAVHRFHRFIRRGMQALRDVHATTPELDWQAVMAHLRDLWESDGPAGHAYDAFYWQAAETILREEWKAITAPENTGATGRVLLAQPLQAELRCCTVEVTADRVIEGAISYPDYSTGPSMPLLPLTVLVRLHTGRPHEEDKNDLTLPLYYLAHQRQHPGTAVRIALAYAGRVLASGVKGTTEPGPGDLEDMTEIARSDADKYLKPGRRQRSKLDKLDEAALGIASGRFAPRPDEHRCAACAYCYVCPADPESAAEIGLTPATAGAERQVTARP
jgi:hypothetical protein